MAGFRKAQAEQASLKAGFYGPQGSGKTFTALLVSEGLAKLSGKRVAFVDTEHGTDFYCQSVPDRMVHPTEFDFDAIYTRSLSEIIREVRGLDPAKYGVVVIDSITHVWEAARNAYEGKQTRIGTIPMQAWGQIKKPYKELLTMLLSSPMHAIICGRQGNEYAEDEDTGELKRVGVKMKAEGETPYEPHILFRMEHVRPRDGAVGGVQAFVEKDRTGVLSGKMFVNPGFDELCKPIIPLLGGTQAKLENDDEVASRDAEAFAEEDHRRTELSAELFKEWAAKIDLSKTPDELKGIGKLITSDLKKQMTTAHVAELREKYLAAEQRWPRGLRQSRPGEGFAGWEHRRGRAPAGAPETVAAEGAPPADAAPAGESGARAGREVAVGAASLTPRSAPAATTTVVEEDDTERMTKPQRARLAVAAKHLGLATGELTGGKGEFVYVPTRLSKLWIGPNAGDVKVDLADLNRSAAESLIRVLEAQLDDREGEGD